jgi:uncharacterized membrane protein
MNPAQFHLALNHFPFICLITGIGILLVGLIRKIIVVQKTAFWVFVVATVLAIPVFYTGEGAEERVENNTNVSREFISRHEETAMFTLWSVLLLGLLSGTALVSPNHKYTRLLPMIIAFVSILVFFALAYTTHLGARISHPELRNEKMEEAR